MEVDVSPLVVPGRLSTVDKAEIIDCAERVCVAQRAVLVTSTKKDASREQAIQDDLVYMKALAERSQAGAALMRAVLGKVE